MLSENKEKKLIELFISIDDFCQALETWKCQRQLGPTKSYLTKPVLQDSEALTLLVFYQYSGYKCFQYYWQELVEGDLRNYFPYLISYERFVARMPHYLPGLYLLLKYYSLLGQRTGTYFIDSKKLVVCDNRRIHSHKVFEGIAQRGKSSTGWFYGFKLHLVINQQGQVMNFLLTPGNVADNNQVVLTHLLEGLQGECYGDKGYLSSLFEQFYHQGIQLITKVKAKMKNKLLPLNQRLMLKKRALIESVNDLLISVFDLEHSRHRSPLNAMAHMLSALIAYCFYENKPTVFIPNHQQVNLKHNP